MTNNNYHVVLLVGGMSSERDVSIVSGKGVEAALLELGFTVTVVDVDKNVAQNIAKAKPDVVFNALHGTYGEDGCIAGMLEIMGIPYTHSGVEASAIAMNKETTKQLLAKRGVLLAKGEVLSAQDVAAGKASIAMPYVIKPVCDGSSVGVFVIKSAKDIPPLEKIEKFGEMIVEEFIEGSDLFCATLDDGSLGVIEVRPKTGFYDYKNKYTEGMADHIMPAPVNEEIYNTVMDVSFIAHKMLKCRGLSRSDFRYDQKNDKVYFLEINTHPGLTPLSLAPEIAEYRGISYKDLVLELIKLASCKQTPFFYEKSGKNTLEKAASS